MSIDGTEAGRWEYQNADGTNAFWVARFDVAGGGKEFRPFMRQGLGWVKAIPRSNRPLFNAPHLLGEKRVYVVEGEKCCELLCGLGLRATTSANGAKSPEKSDWTPLVGCEEVVILPDFDNAGTAFARKVVGIITSINPSARIKIVRLPGQVEQGDDVEQFLALRRAGGVDEAAIRAEIEELADAADPAEAGAEEAGELVVCRASEIKTRPVDWLWDHRLVAGAINMFVGMPDQGKGVLTMDIAARVSVGTPWPLGQNRENRPGSVVVVSGEDSPETTIVPRLLAAGADLRKIEIVQGVQRDGVRDCFDLANDVSKLERLRLTHPDLRLVIFDPLDSFIGNVDSKIGNAVRRVLWPLVEWCESSGVTALIVHHFNKGASTVALDRVSGSRSFGALPRSVWVVGRDEKAVDHRTVVLPVKLNLVQYTDRKGMAFQIRSSPSCPEIPVAAWLDEEVSTKAHELLSGPDLDSGEGDSADDWLRDRLSHGDVAAAEIFSEGQKIGFTQKMLRRASYRLKVKTNKQGFHVGWMWHLPMEGAREGAREGAQGDATG